MARKKSSSSTSPIAIGNCEVVVGAKNFDIESNQHSLQISLSRNSKIVISVVEDALGKERNDLQHSSLGQNGSYYFVLVNPRDSDAQSKALLQEILTLYLKELPSMNYAANTGKKSMFLERCVSNGKYSTLVLKSKSEEGPGEVVAAISFQIIPADTQYAEVPLAAVSSIYQHKGIGQLTYLEMRKRLQSVGVHSIYCWADVESEGFWFKQGFGSVGQVDTKGRARRLPIRADIRKALCFPGGSTLMISHLNNEFSVKLVENLQLSTLKPIQKSIPDSVVESQHNGDENVLIKKRMWNSSHTSLKSKKVKGVTISRDTDLEDFTLTLQGPFNVNYEDNTQEGNCYKIMLMNIADDAKKSNLTKIIMDLGGSVTSDGRLSTHVITGKVRKTLNFCTALCTGAWVISPAWLKESFREGRFVDEMPYILKDREYELKYRVDLKSTVLRARGSNGGLLKGFEVCLASHVQPPINTLSAIVRSAGGNVIWNLEKVKHLEKTIFVASEDNMEEALSAIKKGVPTFSNEWFMNCVMKQELDLEAPQFAESL